ncbi:tyrosine-type recombinase/integrase [Metabacillus herbersteinensis]|uniref:Tyrosine-type recombinase/integrase n=1 Tax=Metabacillus herbersteinensis TaxID=283816 RepID=A0ABV6GIT9_9BACI
MSIDKNKINGKLKKRSLPVEIDLDNLTNLSNKMTDSSFYYKMLDIIDYGDTEDYSGFNDLEMLYLFVHQEKDTDSKKNRTAATKKEYIRELLFFYRMFVENGDLFDFEVADLNIRSLIKEIRPRNIRKFQQWLKEAPLGKGGKTYSVATLAKKTVVIKAFLSFLYKKRYIEKPLHETFLSTNVHKRDRPDRDLNSVEVMKLLEYFKDHPIVYCLILVLTTTGARIQEICTSRICDISYSEGDYWLKVIGKGNEERECLILEEVLESITLFRERRGLKTILNTNDESPIFTTAKNKQYHFKYLSNYLTNIINKADIPLIRNRNTPLTAHFFRHSYAIISDEQGVDLFKIMQSLGHKKVDTTLIYLSRTIARKNNAGHAWKNSSLIKDLKHIKN